MQFLPGHRDPTVGIVGLGYVGSCIAAALAGRGWNVIGVDTDSRLIEELTGGHCRYQEEELAELMLGGIGDGRLRVTTDYAELGAADVVLLTVGTPVREDGSLADEQLRGACVELSRHLRRGQLLVVKCTVPPGATRGLVLPLLEKGGLVCGVDFGLAFTPERFAEGTALRELRTLPIAVGGLDPESARAAAEFWRRGLGVEVLPLASPESAEIVKLADNWWIDVNIALANELAKFCDLYGVDVLEVIEAANTLPKGQSKINILLPSVGVGGSCLVKDPWMIWHAALQHGLEILTAPAGREINAGMPGHAAQLVIDELTRLGKDPTTASVALLGLAFKNNTGDLRATPAEGVIEALTKAGVRVSAFDPLVDPDQAEDQLGVRPAETLAEAARGADCLAFLTHHREFAAIDFAELPVAESCLILDGRAYFPREKIAALRELGYGYRGIGR